MLLVFLLVLIGIIAVIAEMFLPTAGIIGISGIACIVYSVVRMFAFGGATAGTIYLAVVILATPVLFFVYFRFFPRSFLGKRLILHKQGPADRSVSTGPPETGAVFPGMPGRAHTALRPAGTAVINNRRISVVTGGEFIEKDAAVEVVKIEGNRVVVKKGVPS